jgi:hypothetical protein
MKVSNEILREIADQLDIGFKVFLHKETLELVTYPDENNHDYMGGDEWQDEIKKVKKSPKKFIEIETLTSRDSYKIMESFIDQLDDIVLKNKLVQAIDGCKPFANFKLLIDNEGTYRDDWFKFKNEALLEWITNQLVS